MGDLGPRRRPKGGAGPQVPLVREKEPWLLNEAPAPGPERQTQLPYVCLGSSQLRLFLPFWGGPGSGASLGDGLGAVFLLCSLA